MKDFRLLLTVDSARGDLSRPLRNRGLELFCPPLGYALYGIIYIYYFSTLKYIMHTSIDVK